MAGADKAIVVTTPEVSAVRDADRIIGLLEANDIGGATVDCQPYPPADDQKGDMMTVDDILDILAIGLIGIVPDDENIIISTNRGEPAVADEKSKAGQAYRNITARIMGDKVPIMEIEEPGFMAKVKKFFGVKAD